MQQSEDLMPRVERGAAWLDKHKPGWFARVNLKTLQLDDGCRCVLAQVFQSEFCVVMGRVGSYLEVADHGFAVHVSATEEQWAATLLDSRLPTPLPLFSCNPDVLRECWVSVILTRRFIAKHSVELQQAAGAVDPVEGIAELTNVHARI